MNRNYLLVLLLTLPAASHAVPPPAFSGPPTAFAGFDTSTEKAYFRLNLAKGGEFTGVLDFTGGTHNTIRGTLDVSGSFSGIAKPSLTPFTLSLTGSTVSTYVLTGSAAGVGLEGFPLAYAKGQPVTEAGRYTSATVVSGTGNIPRGYGYGTLIVSKAGTGLFSGKLPDGTPFTTSSRMVIDGTTFHLYVLDDRNLNNKKGFLVGYTVFESPNSFTGAYLWQKPATKSPYYPDGFEVSVETGGALYPKSNVPFSSGSGTMIFLAGNLATTGSASLTISSTGVVKVDGTFPTNVKLSINRNTGAFGGTFDFPSMVGGTTVNSPVKYRGAVFQSGSASVGYGYFLSPVTNGTGASGSVQIIQN
jgi:hypothetical protein